MNTCKTCKWWHNDAGHDGYKQCNERHWVQDEYPPDGLCVAQAEYTPTTGPDFGCIHHHPRSEGKA